MSPGDRPPEGGEEGTGPDPDTSDTDTGTGPGTGDGDASARPPGPDPGSGGSEEGAGAGHPGPAPEGGHHRGGTPTGPSLIVAVARDGAIGRAGDLPWHAPEDLAHFRRVTDGHTLVMGRRTWESIGRPLPGRRIVVVASRPLRDLPATVTWAPTPAAALAQAHRTDPAPAVAGGAAIYAALLDQVVRIDRTRVDVTVPDADTWFPELDPGTWALVASRPGEDPRLTFDVLERTRPAP